MNWDRDMKLKQDEAQNSNFSAYERSSYLSQYFISPINYVFKFANQTDVIIENP